MFSSRSIRLLFHVIAWLLFFGLIIASSAINRANSFSEIFSPPFLLFYGTFLFVFYMNEWVLLPKLYFQKKHFIYFALIVAMLVSVALLQPFDRIVKGQRESVEAFWERPLPPGHPPPFRPHGRKPPQRRPQQPDIVSIILFIAVWMASLVFALFRQWRQTEHRAAQAEIDKAKAELSFLKAQVNPHFLFNTLNNIYSLTVEKSDRAPAAVMKLSNIMRYVTDEAKNDFVPLQHEVACLSDYISLQQLRLNSKTNVRFTATGPFERLQIAPLILMPFVENVFKYGISSHQPSTISITVAVAGSQLHFFTENQLAKQARAERTGIGLQNTRQRLQHLYPGRHTLAAAPANDTFTVQLILDL